MFQRLKTFFWGLLLLPLTLSTYYHLPTAGFALASRTQSLLFLLLGVLLYILFETLFNRPMRTYVFGHELTHILASWVTGGEVLSMDVSKKGGSVSLTKSNFFVALAPYCVPIYTVFVLLLYFLFQTFYPFKHIQGVFLTLVGFSLAFHCSLTLFATGQEQPDIQKTGVFFSLVFILLVNAWVFILLSKFFSSEAISLRQLFLDVMSSQIQIWKWIGKKIALLIQWTYAQFENNP